MRVDAFLDAFDAHCSCLLGKIGAIFMKAGEITKFISMSNDISYLCQQEGVCGNAPRRICDSHGNVLPIVDLIRVAHGHKILLFADLFYGHANPLLIFPDYHFLQTANLSYYKQIQRLILELAYSAKLYLLMCDMEKSMSEENGKNDLTLLEMFSHLFDIQDISHQINLEDEIQNLEDMIQELKDEKESRYKKRRAEGEERLEMYLRLRPQAKNDTQVYKEILTHEKQVINESTLGRLRTWKSRMYKEGKIKSSYKSTCNDCQNKKHE